MSTLLLFTGSYPYSVAAENTFIPQELAVLSQYFEKIVVIPSSTEGEREPIDLPNVTVDVEFAAAARTARTKWMEAALSVVDFVLIRECLSRTSLFVQHPGAFRRVLGYHVRSRVAQAWIRKRWAAKHFSTDDLILYTWWFDAQTLGLARFGARESVHVVTRAHGYDLYESR